MDNTFAILRAYQFKPKGKESNKWLVSIYQSLYMTFCFISMIGILYKGGNSNMCKGVWH